MNSMDIIPFAIAKRELKDNGIDSTPASLLFGLIPGMKVPFIQQVILNKAVVDGEIAVKEKDDANLNKATSDQKFNDLKSGIDESTNNLSTNSSSTNLQAAINEIRVLAGFDPIVFGG